MHLQSNQCAAVAKHTPLQSNSTKLNDIKSSDHIAPRRFVEPYDFIVGSTHHKTGTFQLHCLFKHASKTAGLAMANDEKCFKDNTAGATSMLACMQSKTNNTTVTAAPRPILFKTYHGIRQLCQLPDTGATVEPCLSFMLYKACTKEQVEAMKIPSEKCTADVPPVQIRKGYFNIIRNPIDTVLSAFSFHTSRPKTEPWLYKQRPVKYLREQVMWAGAERRLLRQLGLGRKHEYRMATYVDMLTQLPVELGVLLEFYHSLPEIYSIARQYEIVGREQGAVNARFEELRDQFNTTVRAAAQHLKLASQPEELVEAAVAGGCDPGTWSEAQRAASQHVTDGKQQEMKDAAAAALMGYAPARHILCSFCDRLEYDEPRCTSEKEEEEGSGNRAQFQRHFSLL